MAVRMHAVVSPVMEPSGILGARGCELGYLDLYRPDRHPCSWHHEIPFDPRNCDVLSRGPGSYRMPLGLKPLDHLQGEKTQSLMRMAVMDPVSLNVADHARDIDPGFLDGLLGNSSAAGVDLVHLAHRSTSVSRPSPPIGRWAVALVELGHGDDHR